MGLRPTYMDETHLESMSFDGVGGDLLGTPSALYIEQSLFEAKLRSQVTSVLTSSGMV